MIHGFPIDYVRATLEQVLLEQHIKNPDFLGGESQVFICSLYEQLLKGDDVDRYVEKVMDITNQQNRTNLILNGVILAPENPTITNLYSCTIIPLTWLCSLRCTLKNRDTALETLNNLIEELKGAKVDIACLKCVDSDNHFIAYKPFVVGTIGHNEGAPTLKNGDYLGDVPTGGNVNTFVTGVFADLTSKGITVPTDYPDQWYYVGYAGKICVVRFYGSQGVWYVASNDGQAPEIVFPPEHESFEKWKVSLSFEAERCDEPYTLNGEEYIKISIGGSATIQNASVMFGNDLVKIEISKYGIKSQTPIVYNNPTKYYLEPLEMPSGNNPNTRINQLVSNNFKSNSQTDAITVTLQYSFVMDKAIAILKEWFDYGRYGKVNIATNNNQDIDVGTMTPNLIYNVVEYWSSWGDVEPISIKTRISDSVDVENTEGDTLTLGITMQVQGDND